MGKEETTREGRNEGEGTESKRGDVWKRKEGDWEGENEGVSPTAVFKSRRLVRT